MAKINILTKDVFNQISAGEVVERPSSIVKELFENSIDAGATAISVEIENGGINLISVEDNGCGIENDQLEKVFYPHATSKISKASDLQTILLLPFQKLILFQKPPIARLDILLTLKVAKLLKKGKFLAKTERKLPFQVYFLTHLYV